MTKPVSIFSEAARNARPLDGESKARLKQILTKRSHAEGRKMSPLSYNTFDFLCSLRRRLNEQGLQHAIYLNGSVVGKCLCPALSFNDHDVMIWTDLHIKYDGYSDLQQEVSKRVAQIFTLTRDAFEEEINLLRGKARPPLERLPLPEIGRSYLWQHVQVDDPIYHRSGNHFSLCALGRERGKSSNARRLCISP